MLHIHQLVRQQFETEAETGTPEQQATADLAGQETAEVPAQETTETPQTPIETPSEPDPVVETTQTEETPIETPEPPAPTPTEKDWVGLDAEVGNVVLETLEQDPSAEVASVVDNAVAALVENRTLTQSGSRCTQNSCPGTDCSTRRRNSATTTSRR